VEGCEVEFAFRFGVCLWSFREPRLILIVTGEYDMSDLSTSDVFLISSTEAAPLRKNWGWTVAFGALLVLAGFIALGSVLTATIATVLVVGVAMIASGFTEIVYGVAMRSWKKFFLWVLLGVLYVIGGFAVFENPLLAASFLTLVLGAGLVASGLLRIVLAFHLPKDASWIFVGLSGVVTLLLGVVVVAQWPISSLWLIGTFLGVDLIFAGGAWIGVGLTLRRAGA
jgi:aquaporin Z